MKSGPYKSLDEAVSLIAQLIHDAYASCECSSTSLRHTTQVLRRRAAEEGWGFLTKTLPRLGKKFDECLAGGSLLTHSIHGFSTWKENELPRFLGELFSKVLHSDGSALPLPDAQCVRSLREILYLFYKYELPYSSEQEQAVIDQFVKTEQSLSEVSLKIDKLDRELDLYLALSPRALRGRPALGADWSHKSELIVLRRAKILLSRLLSRFDYRDICPKHGPGSVSTKQKLRSKFIWTNISKGLTELWPIDAYFYASNGHVCDSLRDIMSLGEESLSAQVILVPKDSRGPRLISCEPVDYQWIQQGLQRALYNLVEHHPLTKWSVFFTDQQPNRIAALFGSATGRYATLDLKEASDRVTVSLVNALFPEHVKHALLAARTVRTRLPDGSELPMLKFAPMGSAICFPILALSIWSLLAAGLPDVYSRDTIHVYGDDVIVPSQYASSAITILESFGLMVNRSKSCLGGFFRESCGMDAFKGIDVTPVRIRRPLNESPHPDTYESWISYANSFLARRRYRVYNYIVEKLERIYGPIPTSDMGLPCPSLCGPVNLTGFKRRTNKDLQRVEFLVRVTEPVKVRYHESGWPDLLRYFTEKSVPVSPLSVPQRTSSIDFKVDSPSAVSVYTVRRRNRLKKRWISPVMAGPVFF